MWRKLVVSGMVGSLLLAGGCSTQGKSNVKAGNPAPASSAKEPILLAVMMPLSGATAPSAPGKQAAVQLAVDEINQNGGILGQTLKVSYWDENALQKETFTTAMAENPFAFVGFDGSDAALLHYGPIVQAKKLLMISGAGSPDLTGSVEKDPNKYRFLFRSGNHTRDWAQAPVVFMKEIAKAKTYFYLGQSNSFGYALEGYLADLAKSNGIEPAGSYFVRRGETNFTETLDAMKKKQFDVLISYIGPSAAEWGKTYNEQGLKVPYYDIAAIGFEVESEIQAKLGAQAHRFSLSLFAADTALTPLTKPFYTQFKQKTSTTPGGLFDVRLHDSVKLIANAIKQAGAVDTEKVIKTLETTKYAGVAGTYEFDASHQAKWGPNNLSGLIGQWQKGKLEIIWPEKLKTASYIP